MRLARAERALPALGVLPEPPAEAFRAGRGALAARVRREAARRRPRPAHGAEPGGGAALVLQRAASPAPAGDRLHAVPRSAARPRRRRLARPRGAVPAGMVGGRAHLVRRDQDEAAHVSRGWRALSRIRDVPVARDRRRGAVAGAQRLGLGFSIILLLLSQVCY